MATPSLAMIPSAYADSKVYSVLPNNGDGDFTFNRDSSATRVGQNGLIQTVGYFGNDIVLNGDFSNGSTNWALNSNWSVANNKATADGTSNSIMFQSNVLQDNTPYLVSYTLSNFTQGSININLSGVSGATRTTNGTYTEYVTSGTSPSGRLDIQGSGNFIVSITNISIKEVLGDQPRLNYDISNGVVQSCPSLLLEPASTNLINFSEPTSSETTATGITYESYIWATGHFTNCIKFGDNSQTRYRYFTGTIANSTEYVISAFVIMDDLSEPTLGTNSGNGDFILRLGGTTASTGNLPNVNMGNNIYRVSSLITSGASGGTTGLLKYSTQSNIGFRIVGFQVEALSYATSYIPTNGSSQTRAAETCNGAGTSSTFNDSEGVLYAELKALSADGTNRYISLNDGTTSNRVNLFYDTNNVLRGFITGISSMATSATITDNNKVAIKYKSGDIALWLNGVEVATKTDAISLSGLSSLSFDQTGGLNWYGNVKDIRVYNEALTDAQLQTLTTL